ncbi:hypothetical protein ACFLQU_02245 [Verrucomicrobiota bacterium]
MKVRFTEALERNASGRYAHYNHTRFAQEGWEYCDVRSLISERQDEWVADLERWHIALTERAAGITDMWWLAQGSRFHTWYPSVFKPLVFAVAMLDYCRAEGIDEITLLACPREVRECLADLAPGLELVGEGASVPEFARRSLLWEVLRWGRMFVGTLPGRGKLPDLRGKRAIVYSHVVDGAVDINREDHFFGRMLDEVPGLAPDDILWVYLSRAVSRKRESTFMAKLRERGHEFVITRNMMGPLEALDAAARCAGLNRCMRRLAGDLPVLKLGSHESRYLPRMYCASIVENVLPIVELEVYHAFRRILRAAPDVRTLCYPYEEKPLERAILRARDESGRDVTAIGYSHSIHNPLHRYYGPRPTAASTPARPDVFAVTGPAEKAWFERTSGTESGRVHVVGSSRYVEALGPPVDFGSRESLNVLVMVGQAYEMNMLANLVDEEPRMFEGCNLTIRKYPFGWSREQDEGIDRIMRHVPDVTADTVTPMVAQIERCDVALFNSTSGGVIAMLSGRVAVYATLHDVFPMDPFAGKSGNDAVIRCSSASEVRAALGDARGWTLDEYAETSARQREFALSIYAPPDGAAWSGLLTGRANQA